MGFCENCGAKLKEGAAFCANCGVRVAFKPDVIADAREKETGVSKKRRANVLGTFSFIIDIIAFIASWLPVVNIAAIVAAVLGLALGIPALVGGIKKRRRLGLAIAGIVLGVLAVMIVIAMYAGTDFFESY